MINVESTEELQTTTRSIGALLPLLIRPPTPRDRAQQRKHDETTALANQSHHVSDLHMFFPRKPCEANKLRYKRRYPNILKEGIGPPTTQSSDLSVRHSPICSKRSSTDAKTMTLVVCRVKPTSPQEHRK